MCNGCMLYRLTTPRGHRSTPLVAGAVGTAVGRRPSSSSVRTISGVLLMMRNFALAPSIVFSALKSPFDFVRSSILSSVEQHHMAVRSPRSQSSGMNGLTALASYETPACASSSAVCLCLGFIRKLFQFLKFFYVRVRKFSFEHEGVNGKLPSGKTSCRLMSC